MTPKKSAPCRSHDKGRQEPRTNGAPHLMTQPTAPAARRRGTPSPLRDLIRALALTAPTHRKETRS